MAHPAMTNSYALRTPDARFAGLPDFPFAPRYVELADSRFGALRMHYLDEGPANAPVVLMLHGEPTWSYLYRRIIPRVTASGYRAVAPDYIGFGRSDKLVDRASYTHQNHVDWMVQFVDCLGVRRCTLLLQDWGGPIGLRLLAERPQCFDAVLLANTLLPNCEPPPRGIEDWPGPLVGPWAQSTAHASDFDVGLVMRSVCVRPLDPAVVAAYEAPFPDASYKAGVLEFPSLIPVREDSPGIAENRRTWQFLGSFTRPVVTAFSDSDPSTKPWERVFRERIPGARGQPHVEIRNAGHFVQEDASDALSQVLLALLHRQYGS
jgi:haloalkane dehalogenase